jgi:hypothetical protein
LIKDKQRDISLRCLKPQFDQHAAQAREPCQGGLFKAVYRLVKFV